MFSALIDFNSCCEDSKKYEYLYNIFCDDFIRSKTYLASKIHIDPISNDKQDGKEKIFWHIITRKQSGNRSFDEPRASRIKWIKPMILNHDNVLIKWFYYFEDDKKIRLYLWSYNHDFVVILQKLGASSSYLVTSFYIDNQKKRDAFEKKFESYKNKTDGRLSGCEWF